MNIPETKAFIKSGFSPIKNKRLFEIVAEQIREAIIEGHYNSGDRLASEKELCQSFGVGRPVVREALRKLENAGTLSVRPGAGGGIFIKKVDSDQLMNSLETIVQLNKVTLKHITEARLAIEKSVWVLTLERLQPEDISNLEENIARARECIANNIRESKILAFHLILAEASKNPLLIMITKALIDILQKHLSQLGLSIEGKKRVLDRHELILKLIKEGNYQEAMVMLEKDVSRHSSGSQP